MSLSMKVLVAEADRLVARAERQVERYRRVNDTSEFALRAELDLKRLHLYRAVLASTNSAHALMPEYALARGLVSDPGREAHQR
jgi:hypothetical protein